MTAPAYRRDLLARAAEASSSLVGLMARLEVPMGSGPRNYLLRRLRHYGIDTSHFTEEPMPERKRRRYSKELLVEAAAHAHSIREVLERMGHDPCDSSFSHIRKRLDQFGIDTSHFTGGHGYEQDAIPVDVLRPAVASSHSLAAVLRALGMPDNTTTRRRLKRSMEFHGLPTDHFTGQGHHRGVPSPYRKAAADILIRKEPGSPRTRTVRLRRALDDLGVPHCCTECGTGDTWKGRRLVLEIDHINGDPLDNQQSNLRYLCPSCHSQTRTFARRSQGTAPPREPVK